jgi:nitrogen fixation/metabolism regulation signal transduction histidine kinase
MNMSALPNLTLRTTTAVGRLAELQRRVDRVPDKPSSVTRAALQELSMALEELQVANEELQMQIEELTATRAESSSAQRAREEFANAVPIPVLWTNSAGVIEKGNEAASQLLNIGKHHLAGKPLMLFVMDRTALFGAVHSLCETATHPSVDIQITVRPRERRPRRMRLRGCRLEHEGQCVWFLHEPVAEVPVVE